METEVKSVKEYSELKDFGEIENEITVKFKGKEYTFKKIPSRLELKFINLVFQGDVLNLVEHKDFLECVKVSLGLTDQEVENLSPSFRVLAFKTLCKIVDLKFFLQILTETATELSEQLNQQVNIQNLEKIKKISEY